MPKIHLVEKNVPGSPRRGADPPSKLKNGPVSVQPTQFKTAKYISSCRHPVGKRLPRLSSGTTFPAIRPFVNFKMKGTDQGKPPCVAAADLFHGRPSDRPATKLSAAVDAINARMGRGSVFFAASGVERKWKMKRELLSGHYTTSWDELLGVK